MKALFRWLDRMAKQNYQASKFMRQARLNAYYNAKAREHIEVMRRVVIIIQDGTPD